MLCPQTDVMHQNVFDYIHIDDRQEFRRQLHWAMCPPQHQGTSANQDSQPTAGTGELLRLFRDNYICTLLHKLFFSSIFPCYIIGDDFVVSSLFHSPEAGGVLPELSCFLNRCFIVRVRCLLDSTSGFLVRGLKFLTKLIANFGFHPKFKKKCCPHSGRDPGP